MLDLIVQGFITIIDPVNLLYIAAGLVLGIIVGAIPGLSATIAIALLVPITFYINPVSSISFLIGIYKGGINGASIPAILINTPGAAGASATVFDGFPMTQQGKAGKALKIAIYASVIGMFAVPEILAQLEKKGWRTVVSKLGRARHPDDDRCTWSELKACGPTILRSSIIGTIIGVIPGLGQTIAAFVGYSEAKRVSKHPETFGHGEIKGVAAAEAANNAVDGATLIPLVTLGIPGDTITAILLGAFMIQGLVPGPTFIQDHGAVIYAILVGMIMANLLLLVIALAGIRLFAKVPNVPVHTLFPTVFFFCVMGAYSVNSSLFDVAIMIFFGVLGYFMRKCEFPVAPFVIAFFIGPLFESNLRRTLIWSNGSLTVFFTRPISLFFIILTVLSVVWAVKRMQKKT